MKLIIRIFLLISLLFPFSFARAQDQLPNGPVYIVQSGDSLWDISQRFGVSMDALEQANGITDPGQIAEGAQLIIPGLEGVQGVLSTRPVVFGENLRSLSRRYQIAVNMLAKLNHLSSPAELYAGYNLVIPEEKASASGLDRSMLSPGQSLLELAVLDNASTWDLTLANRIGNPEQALPGDVLLLPGKGKDGPDALPSAFTSVEVNPFPLLQGKTTVIKLAAQPGMTLGGELMGHPLNFFPVTEEQVGAGQNATEYAALQGIYAMQEPGIYPLKINGKLANGAPFAFSQMVDVREADYPYDRPLTVDPATIDPAVTKPEDAEWNSLALPVTLQKLWDGAFGMVTPLPKDYCIESNECWTSRFGNRRSYNGGPYDRFHTGLDVAGKEGTEIYAAAAGVVVFTGPLTVRGNATMIDHGWGVYTGYMHQSEIKVKVGDRVEAGQLIGLVGGTGRVEGPHLHFEVWVGGVQVDPVEWLQETFP